MIREARRKAKAIPASLTILIHIIIRGREVIHI
jgi:hypothetical protein